MSVKTGAATIPVTRSRVGDFLALTKPRLNSLVVVTAGVGYFLGADAFDFLLFLHTVIGAALVAGGAAALNQVAERDIDDTMERTRRRPLPTGRVQPGEGRAFGVFLTSVGMVQLGIGATPAAAIVAFVTLVTYVFIYTPMKRRTPLATLVGAVPGALPPVIGWAAARGTVTIEAWVLFGIVFLWQLPHFYALAWMYRDDFRRAGLPLLAVIDRDGHRNARHAMFFCLALLPVSLGPSFVGLTGRLYAGTACGCGIAFLILAWRLTQRPSTVRARALFIGSLVYLPLLLGLLVLDSAF